MLLVLIFGCTAPDCSGQYESQAAMDRAVTCTELPELRVENTGDVTTVDLPLIETLSDLQISGPITTLSLPALTSAERLSTNSEVLRSVELPLLETVADFVSLPSLEIQTLDLSSLESVGDISLGSGPVDFALPRLTEAQDLRISESAIGIRTLRLPALETATRLVLEGRLREVEAPSLNVQDFQLFVESPWLERLDLTGLQGNPTLIIRDQTENNGGVSLDLSPQSRPHLCFRGPSDLTSLTLSGPRELAELSIRGVPFTSLELPSVEEIRALDLGESSSLPSAVQDELNDLHSTDQVNDLCPF